MKKFIFVLIGAFALTACTDMMQNNPTSGHSPMAQPKAGPMCQSMGGWKHGSANDNRVYNAMLCCQDGQCPCCMHDGQTAYQSSMDRAVQPGGTQKPAAATAAPTKMKEAMPAGGTGQRAKPSSKTPSTHHHKY